MTETPESRLRRAFHASFDAEAPSAEFVDRAMASARTGSSGVPRWRGGAAAAVGVALVVGIAVGSALTLRQSRQPGSSPGSAATGVAPSQTAGQSPPSAAASQEPSSTASGPGHSTATGSGGGALPVPSATPLGPTPFPDGTRVCSAADVRLDLKTDRPTYRGSTYNGGSDPQPRPEPITFIVTITNVSSSACALASADDRGQAVPTGPAYPGGCYTIAVSASLNGQPVYQPGGSDPRPCQPLGAPIAPGRSATTSGVWDQGSCVHSSCEGFSFGVAPPGHYTASADLWKHTWYQNVPPATTSFDISPPPSPSPSPTPASPSPSASP